MKITKSFNKASKLMKNKIEANNDCNICPCCNETTSMLQYLHKGIINRGIMDGIYKSYATGIFKTKYIRIDCYSCLTCGAEWESEPYEY